MSIAVSGTGPVQPAISEDGAAADLPLVSVVIPTTGRDSLVRAVKSVLAQTYRQVEVIVVYDGPAGELSYAPPADPRVKLIATGERRGSGPARTLGTRSATGTYLALLDDDDVWAPRKLEVQVAILEVQDRSAEIVLVSRFRLVDEQGRGAFLAPKRVKRPDEPVAEYLFVRRWVRWGEAVVHPSTLICKRSLAVSTPWLDSPVHQDWDWLLRLVAARDPEVIMLPEPLVDVTQTVGSASRSTKWRESLAWVSSSRLLTERQRADLLLCTTAAFARAAGDWRAAARIARRAFARGRPGLPACLFFVAFQLLPPRTLTRLARTVPFSTRRPRS
jgi:glycosyltransferase involved in cell wall biosynthesis